MRPARHAEITGAGFAGFAVAILPARAGWRVCVHERAEGVREIGAGKRDLAQRLLVADGSGWATARGRGRGSQTRSRQADTLA